MKNLFLSVSFLILLTTSCQNNKPAQFTILGLGTPYVTYPEVLNGKVKSMTEKNYWALPEGDSYKKGNPLTQADRDSLGGWTDDFSADFDQNGNLITCTGFNESDKTIWKNEAFIENNRIVKRNYFRNDSLLSYDLYTYDKDGFMSDCSRMRTGVDTLIRKYSIKNNKEGYPTELQVSNSKGVNTEKWVYGYNDQNRFQSFKVLDMEGKPKTMHEVKYNDKGKLSELVMKDKDNHIIARNDATYEYDKMGNWVKAFVKDQKNRTVIEERSYTYFE